MVTFDEPPWLVVLIQENPTLCLFHRITPPRTRKWGTISLAWHHRLPLAWQIGRLLARFFLTSAAAAPVLRRSHGLPAA